MRVKVVKNKLAPPFKQAEFDVMFAEGISKMGELVDLGVDKRILDKSGAWYSYKNDRLGQGREAVRDFLKSNPTIARDIENRLREQAALPGRAADKRTESKDEKRVDGKDDKRTERAEARHEDRRLHGARASSS